MQYYIEILKKNLNKILGFLVILLLIFLIIANNQKQKADQKAEIAEYNLKVSTDSIRITLDNLGKNETNKLAYLTNSVENLGKLNNSLAEEVKKIKGSVSTIVQGEVKIVEKPVPFVVKSEFVDSTIFVRFSYDTTYSPGNFRKLSGYSSYDLRSQKTSGQKEQDEIGIKLVTGIKNLKEGKPEIFFKSDYPGLNVTSLEGAVLDPDLFKPKKKTPLITPGIMIGYDLLLWDNKTKVAKVIPGSFSISAGLSFNLFKIFGIKK